MRYPWVNIALLILLVAQLLTGFFGLISGAPVFAWVLWLHGIIGYAILVIFVPLTTRQFRRSVSR